MCSQAGRRRRGVVATGFDPVILLLQSPPEVCQLLGAEVGQDLAVHVQYRGEVLPGKPDHFVVSRFVGDDIHLLIPDSLFIQPVFRSVTPPAVRLDVESNPFWFHDHTVVEVGRIIKWELGRGHQ